MQNRVIIKRNLIKINKNMNVKWRQQFPSVYGEMKFNGNNQRNITLALNELQDFSLNEIREVGRKLGLMYYISQNIHNNQWGLDKTPTNEGGGVIAQASTYVKCVKRAENHFGIHPIFIYGVGIDKF